MVSIQAILAATDFPPHAEQAVARGASESTTQGHFALTACATFNLMEYFWTDAF